MRSLQFEGRAYQEYVGWAETDKKIFKKINKPLFFMAMTE